MQDSLEHIFKTYYRRLCHFAWQLTGDPFIVEDMVQDAFANYWKNMQKVSNDESAIRNFLYTSVRNACYNHHTRKKVVKRWESLTPINNEAPPEILHKIIRSEVMSEVYRVMKLMPEGCREVFRLGYLEGLNNPAIAKTLQVSINTVKTQKQRGLKILRNNLNPEVYLLLFYLLIP